MAEKNDQLEGKFTPRQSASRVRELNDRIDRLVQSVIRSARKISPKDADIFLEIYPFGPALHFDSLTALEPETARILANFKGRELFLNALPTMTSDLAEALTDYAGMLSLNGLKSLDGATAQKLAMRSEISGVSLRGLDAFTDDLSSGLANYRGVVEVDFADVESSYELSEFTSREITIGSRVCNNPELFAKVLRGLDDWRVNDNVLTLECEALTPEAADFVRGLQCDFLHLDSLKVPFGVETARRLAEYRGAVCIASYLQWDSEVREVFLKRKGGCYIGGMEKD